MGKFVNWSVQEGKLQWHFKEEEIAAEERFDGCYVVVSDVPAELMAKNEVVASYKKLSFVEQAFRNLKTVQLEMRPIYHKKDDRIRAHVFICLLAYYVQWHARQRLKPLFDQDGEGKHRQWTFDNVIERLKGVRSERVKAQGVEFDLRTKPDDQQQMILNLMAGKQS
jgi:transposase